MAQRILLTVLFLLACPTLGAAGSLYQLVDLGMGFAGIPRDVNASGRTAGHHGIGFSLFATAVTWNSTGVRTILPTLGGSDAYAMGINDAGLIVGASKSPTSGGNYLATVWDGGVPRALPAPAPFSAALRVNGGGQIVGYTNTTGSSLAYTSEGVLSSNNRGGAVGRRPAVGATSCRTKRL